MTTTKKNRKPGKLNRVAAKFAADFMQRRTEPLDEAAIAHAFMGGFMFHAKSHMWHVVDEGKLPNVEPNRYVVLVFLNGLALPVTPDLRVVRTSESSEYFNTPARKPFAWAYFDKLFPFNNVLGRHISETEYTTQP